MDINGCHVVSKIGADSPDGFSSMVSRYVGFRTLSSEMPADAVKVDRGPFNTIREAIVYAQSWNDAANPPPMPVVAPVGPPAEVIVKPESAPPEEIK